MWDRWKVYCAAFGIDPLLKAFADPVPFMSTFVVQYRLSTVAARGKPVRARQAEDAIRLVGETMELMGVGDKRYVPLRPGAPQKLRIDPRLSRLWKHWKLADPPPSRVKPIPMRVLHKAQALADAKNTVAALATARMMWANVFFLCRPGEPCALR